VEIRYFRKLKIWEKAHYFTQVNEVKRMLNSFIKKLTAQIEIIYVTIYMRGCTRGRGNILECRKSDGIYIPQPWEVTG